METLNIPFSSPSGHEFTQLRAAKNRPISFVVYPGVEIIDLTGPMEVFAFANISLLRAGICSGTAYSMDVLAATPGPITSSCGLQIIANKAYADIHDGVHTLLVVGTPDISCLLCDPALQDWLLTMAPRVKRLASVCTGAFLLAECGLLDGRNATSHWDYCDWLARDYPAIKVEPDRIFVRNGNILTSGGITSGIDMALSMVEEDWGSELALLVARYMVVFLKRPGGQSQFSAYLTSAGCRPEIKDLQAWIMMHLTEDLHVDTLAKRMCMSPRNFARFFLAETRMTPAKFVEMARIDAARHYLGNTTLSIDSVAEKSGFIDPERMRRAFIRQLGINPQAYKNRFSHHTQYPDHGLTQ